MDTKVVEHLGHVEVAWAGRFCDADVAESFAEALACSTRGILVDVVAADMDVPVREIERAARRVARLLGAKVLHGAVLAPDNLSFGLMRVFIAYLGAAGDDLHVCRTRAQADAALEARPDDEGERSVA